MATIQSDMTQEGSQKFSPVLFIASLLTIPICTSCNGNDLIKKGLFFKIYTVMSRHVSLLQLLLFLWFQFIYCTKKNRDLSNKEKRKNM